MSEDKILKEIKTMSPEQFIDVCQAIVRGLGFSRAKDFPAPGVLVAFQEKLIRESTDKMFRTEESWLSAFARSDAELSWQSLDAMLKAAQSAGVQSLLAVVFGEVRSEDAEMYHTDANKADLRSALLSGIFAAELAYDYASQVVDLAQDTRFSFARLRERMKKQARDASWRSQFQSLKALPTRVKPGQGESVLEEADIFRAVVKTTSFLLLGAPGAGKTTSLQVLAEELAQAGGKTPVLMPLNRYSGNLLVDLGKVLCEGTVSLSEDTTRALLSSGAFVVMLDGLNEVQPSHVQSALIDEINRLTSPQSSTARSQWIVSNRKYDFSLSRRSLENLEAHIWELQPLTPDLIYRFLADELGEQEGKDAYDNLGPAIREICGNPLLLNMVLTVRHKTGRIPTGRGALYHQFVDLLLRWRKEHSTVQQNREELSKFVGDYLTLEKYCDIARSAMINLAAAMETTAIPWSEANESIMESLKHVVEPHRAAKLLLDDLVRRGILKAQGGRVSFLHHTFQEYFQAFGMKELPISILIPEGGVEGSRREAVVFLAGIIDSPNPLVERALKYDFMLAYEIVRNTTTLVDKKLVHQVGAKIWEEIRFGGRWIEEQRPLALAFNSLASQLGQTAEQLARDIRQPSDEITFAEELLKFYQELGDILSQQKVFERLGMVDKEKIPNNLLFEAALIASHTGDYQRAIDLYTKYIEQDPTESSAYGRRANVYKDLGRRQEALADYKKALDLSPHNVVNRTNLARLLRDMGQEKQAIEELQLAVHDDPNYEWAHFELGSMMESTNLEVALSHFEQADHLSVNPDQSCIQKLTECQEKLGRFEGAIRSLKRLIELDPTSILVKDWKQKIARFRLAIDEAEERRSVRERLQDRGDISLAILARELLRAASLQFEQATSQWILATNDDKPGLPTPLPVSLLDVPLLTGALIRDVVNSLPTQAQRAQNIVLLTTAETLEQDALIQLSAYRPERIVALITSLEAQDALLQGDRYCYLLLDRALRRAATESDPFKYTTVIQERFEFFGRNKEIRTLTSLIQNYQPVALYGIHKIGKTSLLLQVHQRLNAYSPDITSISVEMNYSIKDASDLYRTILEKLPGEIDIHQGIVSASHFRRILSGFQQRKQRERPGHHILLILDEYPYLIPDRSDKGGIKDYLEVLGIFKALIQEEWFSVLPCGRTSALSRVARWKEGENPFVGILQEQFLGPLTQEETVELVKTLGRKAGISFGDDALDKIFAITGGHPLFTRTLGSWILEKRQGYNVTAAVVEAAAEAYLFNRGDKALLLAIYEERLDKEERRIVRQLAISDRLLLPSELVPKNADEQDRRRIRDSIGNLLDTTVLKEDEKGRLSHRYELLRRAIEQEIKERGL